jgi:hypothetical protein
MALLHSVTADTWRNVQTAGNEKGRVVSLFMAGGALVWISGTRVLNGLDRSKKIASINRLRVSVIFYER